VASSRNGSSPLSAARAAVRSIVPREPVDGALDWVRLKLDMPKLDAYQPLPSLRRDSTAIRTAACISRWDAMVPLLEELEVDSALDVGCYAGWFLLQLGAAGIPSVGVEGHPPVYRTALYALSKSGLSNVGLLAVTVSPETARLLPSADCTLFLSVWHHMVKDQGQEAADEILADCWKRTGKVLFFETGEEEMPAEYGLPRMTPDSRTWIERYLQAQCRGGLVEHLGLHEAGEHQRNVFAVIRGSDPAG
jgi:hypothetical protein